MPAGGNVTPLSDLHGGDCAATPAATPGGAVEVEALHAEGAATPAATPGGTRDDGQTTSDGPWPREGSAFGDASQACLDHVVAPEVSLRSRAVATASPARMWSDVTDEKSATI